MIYPFQIRAARALIGLSQNDLAETSGVGIATIRRIESEGKNLAGTAKTLHRLQKALETFGVTFVDGNRDRGPGVVLTSPLH